MAQSGSCETLPPLPSAARDARVRSWLAVAGVLLVEYLLISLRFDAYSLRRLGGVWGAASYLGTLAPALVVAAASLWMFRRDAGAPSAIGQTLAATPAPQWSLRWGQLGVHALCAATFFWLTGILFGGARTDSPAPLWLATWFAVGSMSALSLVRGFIPLRELGRHVWSTAQGVALLVAVVAFIAGNYTAELWIPLSQATLWLVTGILRPFYPGVSLPGPLLLELGGFEVHIAPACSGFEGMGLITVLTAGVLVVRRRRLLFPRALWLLPLAISAAFVGNALRIAGLMIVGAELDPELAYEAFHSKAGWVAFCAIALSIAALAERHPYFRRDVTRAERSEMENPAAAYLLPFVVLLGTALVTGMFARELDWMYPLRVIGPLLVLYLLRGHYAQLRQQAAPGRPLFALAVGVAVGAVWYATDAVNPDTDRAVSSAVTQAPLAFSAWLAFRLLGAVVVVPICEELAFRGFLLRWLVDRGFTEVSFKRYTPWAVVACSAAFALVHERWLAGALAGLAYAVVQIRGGRLSDAVAAHAASNAVIAAWAVASGEWSRWL